MTEQSMNATPTSSCLLYVCINCGRVFVIITEDTTEITDVCVCVCVCVGGGIFTSWRALADVHKWLDYY
jgi:hypothetical protein